MAGFTLLSMDEANAQNLYRAVFSHFRLKDARVLDAFARGGDLTLRAYYQYVLPGTIEAWELDPKHLPHLHQYTQNVRIGDSYELIRNTRELYDLIVIDSPQGIHSGAGHTWIEHFGFLPQCLKNVAPGGVVVVYVNKAPYDKSVEGHHGMDEYHEYDFEEWMQGRKRFYGEPYVNEEEALRAYRRCLTNAGRTMGQVLITPCKSDVEGRPPYAFHLAMEVL